jgi:hypothetical protein
MGAKECVVGAGEMQTGKLKQVLERSNILITERKKGKVAVPANIYICGISSLYEHVKSKYFRFKSHYKV